MTYGQPTNTDSVIDSREVIERVAELRSQAQGAFEESADYRDGEELVTLEDHQDFLDSDEYHELVLLEALDTARDVATDEWEDGTALVREDYFIDYARELVQDCYEMPAEMVRNFSDWPWRHFTFDWEGVAEDLRVDYTDVTFDGVTYYVRSV